MAKIQKGMQRMCAGKCGLPYRECLNSRQREDLKENGALMSKCLKRNLAGLFSPTSVSRIHVRNYGAIGTGIPFNGGWQDASQYL